jgi:cell pole-organizing protein PopZ
MNQPAKAQEPSMEEILASIRRIISDDDAAKPAKPEPPPKPAAVAPPPKPAAPSAEPAAMSQDDIDAMLSSFDQIVEDKAPELAPPPPPPPEPEPEPEPEPDVLELTEATATKQEELEPEPEWPTFRTIGEPDVMFAEPPPEPPPPPPPPPLRQQAAKPAQPPPPEPPIMSTETGRAVDAAFNALAHTVLVQNAKTLEDLVKEMLRPLLKNWLDDNLPGLVERLVRAEIERVSRGR